MKTRYLVLISLVVILFQMTLLHTLRIFGIIPNLILLWVVIVSVYYPRSTSLWTAALSGLLLDVLSGRGIGVHLIIYVVIAFGISAIEEFIFKDNYVTPVVLITLATVFSHVVIATVHFFSTFHLLLLVHLVPRIIPELAYNIVVGLILYRVAIHTLPELK